MRKRSRTAASTEAFIACTAQMIRATFGDTHPVGVAGTMLPDGTPAVSGTASRKDGRVAVTAINRHFDQAAVVTVTMDTPANGAARQLLSAASPRLYNTSEQPDIVGLQPLSIVLDGATAQMALPPHSMATVQFS